MNIRSVELPVDSPALEGLISVIEERDRHPALGERKYFDLVDPLPAGRIVRSGLVAEDTRGTFAYLPLVDEGKGLWTIEMVVHPDYRRPDVLDGLLERGVGAVLARGGESVRLWAYVAEVADAARRAGFTLERELFHMRAPLPIAEVRQSPDGIEFRGFRNNLDEQHWLEANNRVFAGHPENGNWGIEDLDRRRRRPWFSSDGLRMAWDGNQLAGFCWTKTPSVAGEIYVIGVLPEYQGIGLGKALLLEGIDHMHTRAAAQVCVLYVDGANTPARKMYESMGFRRHHTDRSFVLASPYSSLIGAGTLSVSRNGT